MSTNHRLRFLLWRARRAKALALSTPALSQAINGSAALTSTSHGAAPCVAHSDSAHNAPASPSKGRRASKPATISRSAAISRAMARLSLCLWCAAIVGGAYGEVLIAVAALLMAIALGCSWAEYRSFTRQPNGGG